MDLDKFSGGALVGFNFGKEKQFHLDFIYQGYYDFDGSKDVGSIVFDGQLFTGQVDSSAQLLEGDIEQGREAPGIHVELREAVEFARDVEAAAHADEARRGREPGLHTCC